MDSGATTFVNLRYLHPILGYFEKVCCVVVNNPSPWSAHLGQVILTGINVA